jgi:hypothetical protein
MDDDLILAAVSRAVLHGPARRDGAPRAAVLAHLAVPPRTARARAVRGRLQDLERSGALRRCGTSSAPAWRLGPPGARRLAALAAAGRSPALPESPQRLAWRRARVAAGQELPRFAVQLAADLARAESMLAALEGAGEAPRSDVWLTLGRTLQSGCRRIGSAWHCLHEWPEPDDEHADRDGPLPGEPEPQPALRALRAGRRNVNLWREPD